MVYFQDGFWELQHIVHVQGIGGCCICFCELKRKAKTCYNELYSWKGIGLTVITGGLLCSSVFHEMNYFSSTRIFVL